LALKLRRDPATQPAVGDPGVTDLSLFSLHSRASMGPIVVAYDGSAAADDALAWARRLAQGAGARIVLASVDVPAYVSKADGGPGWWSSTESESGRESRHDLVARAARATEAARLDVGIYLAQGMPEIEVARAAILHEAALVVLGAPRKEFGRTASLLLAQTTRSVLLARGPPTGGAVLSASPALEVAGRVIADALGVDHVSRGAGSLAARVFEAGADLLAVANPPGYDECHMPCSLLVVAP
jgi:nucleotide-binding universal stress UspA family protein